MSTVIFIHAAIIGRYAERILQYLEQIKQSKLYEHVNNIYIDYVGDKITIDDIIQSDPEHKISIKNVSSCLQDYELPTHMDMYQFAKEHPDTNILYLHTKGIHQHNQCIEDWVEYMTYFNIIKWKQCIDALTKYHTVGVDLRLEPELHYSGNFWWSTSNHIASLPEPKDFSNLTAYPNALQSSRHNQEFWICYDKNIQLHGCLWESNINCYERHLHRYASSNYDNL